MLLAALAASAGLLGACDSADAVRPTPCALGTPQVVVGECLAGLTVYSDSADTVRLLGPPGRYVSSESNDFGFRLLLYDGHPIGGQMTVALAPRGLYSISVGDGFTAVTDDGIGFGTPRVEVQRLLGPPASSAEGPGGFDIYNFPADSVSFYIGYAPGQLGVDVIDMRTTRDVF